MKEKEIVKSSPKAVDPKIVGLVQIALRKLDKVINVLETQFGVDLDLDGDIGDKKNGFARVSLIFAMSLIFAASAGAWVLKSNDTTVAEFTRNTNGKYTGSLTLSGSGTLTAPALTISGAVSAGSLSVSGASAINTLTATGVVSSTAQTTLGAVNMTGAVIASNTLTATELTVNEDATVTSNLTVTGDADVDGVLNSDDIVNSASITTATINATTSLESLVVTFTGSGYLDIQNTTQLVFVSTSGAGATNVLDSDILTP